MKKDKSKFIASLKLASWIGLIGIFFYLSIAATNHKSDVRCDKLFVRYKNDKNLGFIQSKDVLNELILAQPNWSNQKVKHIKFNIIENNIQKNEYVKNAELYLDSKNELNILIEPKSPLARINSSNGSYYLSENWDKMSLSSNYSKRIIHISGQVNQLLNPKSKKDSFIIHELKTVISFIQSNNVWQDAIDQIYVDQFGKIELVLVFCQPTIKLGFVDVNFEKRIEKLDNFFKLIATKKDLSIYQSLDFQYSNQVIGIKQSSN